MSATDRIDTAAVARLARLNEFERSRGVVAVAGEFGSAVARAARTLGLRAEIAPDAAHAWDRSLAECLTYLDSEA